MKVMGPITGSVADERISKQEAERIGLAVLGKIERCTGCSYPEESCALLRRSEGSCLIDPEFELVFRGEKFVAKKKPLCERVRMIIHGW